jgi:hypothetical protein
MGLPEYYSLTGYLSKIQVIGTKCSKGQSQVVGFFHSGISFIFPLAIIRTAFKD